MIGLFSILVAYQEKQFEGRSMIYFPLLSFMSVHAVISHVSEYTNLINSRTKRE